MKSIWIFLSGLGLGILLTGLSYSYHFVMSDEGFLLVSKPQATLSDIYADIREWSLEDWGDHPELARALIADGRSQLVGNSVADGLIEKYLPPVPADRSARSPSSGTFK